MRQFNLDVRKLDIDPSVRTGHTVILSDVNGGRTICGHFLDVRSRPLTEADLEGVALLSVDPFLGENAIRAAKIARACDVTVFAIELTPDHQLAKFCDVVINSAGFMRRHRMGPPADVAVGLLKAGVETVVITRGKLGSQVFQENGNSFDQRCIPSLCTRDHRRGRCVSRRPHLRVFAGMDPDAQRAICQRQRGHNVYKGAACRHIHGEEQVLKLIAEE